MTPATTETTAQVIAYAIQGRLTKHALATLLVPESRRGFLDACATIETSYTDACAAAKDPCLESGCSCEGAICLQPLLRAGAGYQRACGTAWATLFADGRHRDPAWRHTLSEYELG